MIWLKFIHIAAIAIWAAGLISLPALYVSRTALEVGDRLHRLQALVRYLYVQIVSPAAFVSVGTGVALIFVQGTFEAWFSLKLLFVGILVFIHVITGLVIIELFDRDRSYPVWRFIAVTVLTGLVVVAILLTVLWKPDLPDALPSSMSEPGALGEMLGDIIPFLRR